MTVKDLIDLLATMPADKLILVGLLDADNNVKGIRLIHDVTLNKLYPTWDEAVIIS